MDRMTTAGPAFDFARPVEEVARDLLGMTFLLDGVGGTIVETEAYRHDDPASHSFNGRTPRNAVMFGAVGRLYVYRSYGMHWCANIVAGTAPGSAVLLRALAPTHRLDAMRARRGQDAPKLLCAGPGRLAQALAITAERNGASVTAPPFGLLPGPAPLACVAGPRIGISKAAAVPWRFSVAGSPFLSRPFSAAAARSGDKASPR